MPVAAGMVDEVLFVAVVALIEMSAQSRCTATHDGVHGFEVCEGYTASASVAEAIAVGRTEASEDVGDSGSGGHERSPPLHSRGPEVNGAGDLGEPFAGQVEIDSGGRDVGVSQQLLDEVEIDAVVQEMCGEGMAKGAYGSRLGDAGLLHGLLKGLLDDAW